MNSAPSSMGTLTPVTRWVRTRPPIRSRASMMQTRLPAPESSRADASPAAPPPMTMTSYRMRALLSHDLRPREMANGHHLLVNLDLRRFIAQHTPQILDFGRHQ